MSDELVQFLRARLGEGERCQQDPFNQWHHPDCEYLPSGGTPTFPCNCGVPARVLADVEAKRGVVARYEFACREAGRLALTEEEREVWVQVAGALQSCVLRFAAIHDDHPDYRAEWRAGEDTA